MRDQLETIRKEVDAALVETGKKLRVTFETGNIRYSDLDCTIQLRVTKTNKDGSKVDIRRADYTKWAKNFSLQPEWLDKTFPYKGDTFTIIGLTPNARKYRVVCRRHSDGEVRIFTSSLIRELMTTDSGVKTAA